MENTDSNATQKSNDLYEEDQDDTNETGDDDLWPDGGMVCPVTGCGTKFYVDQTTYWGHWNRMHHEQLRQLYCPKCPHKSLNKRYFATHLTKKHKIKMSDLDQVIASAHTELIPNKEFIPPGTQRCPKRKSVSSESQMAPKRQRMKPPSQDGQCKHNEDNSSMTTAETDVKASICNVAKEVSSDNEIERLPIPLSETGQKEGSDENVSHANETSRNDNIPHSHHSKKATVFPPTEAQNISVSDAESDKWTSDSNFIIEMEKERSEVVQLPDKGWHEGGMKCHVPACGSKHFDTINSYQAHWKQIHSDTIKEFKCPLCSFKHCEKLQLQRHLRLKHKVDKTALQAMLSIMKVEVSPNEQYIDPGTVEFPKGKVHVLSGPAGKTKRPRLSAAQVFDIKQGSGGEKKSTKQTDFNDPAVASNLGSDLGIQSDNKNNVDDFGFEDKRILQVGLKVDMAAAISKEDNVSNDTVKQVVAMLQRKEIEINESVTLVRESSVEIMRKDPDVDKATVAIDTQVLECVTKLMESVVDMKRKVTIESEKTIDTQVSESLTNVTESAVQVERKFAIVDKGTIEMEKAIDTQVLECVPKITECAVQTADVDKDTIEMDKAIYTQVLECVPKVTECAVQIADVGKDTLEMDKAIYTQVLECVPKVTECAVQIADVGKDTLEMDKAIDTQVLECVPKITECDDKAIDTQVLECVPKIAECAVLTADVDNGTIEMEKAIDTQVLECVPKIAEYAVQTADVDKGTIEMDKAIDTQVLECVLKITECAVQIADVDNGTIEMDTAVDTQVLECVPKITECDDKAIDTQVLECVPKITECDDKAFDTQVLECVPKITECDVQTADVDKGTTEMEKAIDTQVLECVLKITECAVQIADVDKGTIEMDKPIDTQVLECVPKVTKCAVQIADVDNGTIEMDKAIDTQVLECVLKITECAVQIADVDNGTIEMDKAIDTQALECFPKVTECAVQTADVDQDTIEMDKDTQVLVCVGTTDIQRNVDSKKVSEAVMKIETVTDSTSNFHDIPCDRIKKEADKSITVIPELSCIGIRQREDEEKVNPPVEIEIVNDRERHGIYISYDTVIRQSDDKSECNDKDESECDIKDKMEYNYKHQSECNINDQSQCNNKDQSECNIKDQSECNNKDQSECNIKDKMEYNYKHQSEYNNKDQSECNIKDQSEYNNKDQSECNIKDQSEYNNKDQSECNIKDQSECNDNDQSECDIKDHRECAIKDQSECDIKDQSECDIKDQSEYNNKDQSECNIKDQSEYNNKDQSECNIKDQSEYNNKDQSECDIKDQSEYNIKDQSECNIKDQSECDIKDHRECAIKDQSECDIKDQSECDIKDQSECDIKDQSEYNNKDQSECNIKDQSECNNKDQSECNIKDQSEYNNKDQSECDIKDHRECAIKDQSECAIKDQSECAIKDQSECAIKDQSECDIKVQSDHDESDQDLTVTDDSELDEAKEAEDLDTVVRPIFLDGQMLCPGSGCFNLDQVYGSLKAFYKHWQDEHQSSVQRFECPSCSFKDVRKLEIRRHLKTEHNKRHRGVLEELMSLVKLEGTPKTAETSSKRKSTIQLKTKIKKHKISLESDVNETKDGKDTKDKSPKDKGAIRAEKQCVGESNERLSPKKEKVVWFFGMSCPVKNCCTRKFVSPREFHNHWENVHNPYIKKFECPICQYQNTQREVVGNHLRLSHNAVNTNDVRDLSQIKMVDVGNPMYKDPGMFYFGNVPIINQDVKTTSTMSPVQAGTDGFHELKKAEDTGIQANEENEKKPKDSIPVHWVLGLSCPVKNCGASYFMTFLSFQSHWENIHNKNILKFKCPLCTFTNISKPNIIAHLSLQHKMSDAMIKTKTIQIQNVKIKNNRYIDPGCYSFSVMEQFRTDQTNTSLSEKKEMDLGGDLKRKTEKTRIVTWMEGMCCPVKACGSETYLTLDSFSNHWIKTHHLEFNIFKCFQCTFKTDQKSDILNHLKSRHWILAEKNETTALTKVNVVKVLNSAFKDTEGYYFESPRTEEAECSLSKSENKSSEQASDEMDLCGDLKGKTEKSRKVTWMEGMCCPVKACGSETYLTLDSFSNHWIKTHHLEFNMFQCSRCVFMAIQKSEIKNHLKSHHWILAEKDVMAALTKVNVVKVLNPEFKDTKGYYFESPVTEEEAVCSLSESENKSSEQASNEMDLGGDLKGKTEKTRIVTWMEGMCCPVKACGSETYLTLNSFSNHWIKTHHLELNMFQCSRCTFKAIQKSEIKNHLKSHHWILAEKDVMAALTKVNVVKVLNPEFKDTEGYYFESPVTEEEAECSLSESENKSSEQASNVTIGTCESSVKAMKNSPSENQEVSLKSVTSNSAAGNEEPIKVVFVSNMRCPVDKCGTHGFRKLSEFKYHWKVRHLPFREHFICKICNLGKTAQNYKYWHLKNIYCHIENIHGIKYPTSEQNIVIEHITNFQFVDPGPLYFEKVARSTDGSKSASYTQKKEEKESKSMSEEGMPKMVVKWKYNMTCPIHKCVFKIYDSWTTYCQHWKRVHEQRYLKTHACPKCSFRSGPRSHLVSHLKQCHNLAGRELERAAEEIKFVDIENPSFIDPGNYTCNWFKKSNANKKPSTTASSEISKSDATLQKKGTEPTKEKERYPKKFIFAPGMPCPVKNCSSVQISSYSAFVHHWNEQHALMLKKFACTMCDFKHIQKSIVFMHVRKEHGMPSYVITRKIKTVDETNVKAEELYVPDLPTDHRRSIVMVKPDDSGQSNTCDINGGKIKEVTDVVEEIEKSDENIGKLNEQKDESRDESDQDESKGQKHEDTCTDLRDEKKPLEGIQPADVDRENVLTNNTTQMVYKSSDSDTKLRMSASENQEEKEASSQKKSTEPAGKEQRFSNKLIFAPGMPCPVKNCSSVPIKSYTVFVHHWNEQHALILKKFACTMCDFKHIQKSIVFMHVRKEHGMPSHVIAQKITTVTETNNQYVDVDELHFPEFPTADRKLLIMVKPDDSETGAFEEVLSGSSAEQPTVTVQTEVKQLAFNKDIEDTIEKEKFYVKGKDESTKEDVKIVVPSDSSDVPKIVVPSGSSDVPKIVVNDEDLISDFEEDSVTIDMSEFICLDEIGDEDAEASKKSPEKQIEKETELPGDQDGEIQDKVSPPTEDDQIEDILNYFICIDDIGDDKDNIGNEKDNIGNEKDNIGNEKDNIGDEERS